MYDLQCVCIYMQGIAGAVLMVVVVMVVVTMGGGRRPRSKLKTGWTGSAAAWTAPAGRPGGLRWPKLLCASTQVCLPATLPVVSVGPEQLVQGLWSLTSGHLITGRQAQSARLSPFHRSRSISILAARSAGCQA